MSKFVKSTVGLAIALLAVVFLIRAPLRARLAGPADEKGEQSSRVASRVSVQGGEIIITLDQATLTHMRLVVAPLRATSTRKQLRAMAVVLPVQNLVNLSNNYVGARTRLYKAHVHLNVTRKEYERLRTLYRENQNVSAKQIQAAEGAWRADQADLRAAEQELRLEQSLALQGWGKAVGDWLAKDSPELNSVLEQRKLLVQVTLPPGELSVAPQTAFLRVPEGGLVSASLVSPFPRVDPRIQGSSFLYDTAAHVGLAPGMSLVARLPLGRLMKGVVVPESAVVWWQGSTWVYQQVSAGHFARREVSTDTPVGNGWFLAQGLAPGDRVVVTGAQMLLSEESRSQIQAPEED